MSNFILRDVPEATGDLERDFYELSAWCQELRESLWISDFLATQQKKSKGGETK